MQATSYAHYITPGTCACCAGRMPSSMSMPMSMAAAASTIMIETGVRTSVSLFVVVLSVCSLLLASLVVLISLTLSLTGLTGLKGLESLVGRIAELATHTAQGV